MTKELLVSVLHAVQGVLFGRYGSRNLTVLAALRL